MTDPHEIVNIVEEAHNEYIKYNVGNFYCLVCDDKQRHEGSKFQAKVHIENFHQHIAANLETKNNESIKKLFVFNKSKRTFLCLFCNRQFRGSLFNAKDHVSSKHKEIAFKLGILGEMKARKQLKRIRNDKKTKTC